MSVFDRVWINVETGRRPATSALRLRVSEQHTLTSLRKHLIHQTPGSAATELVRNKNESRVKGGRGMSRKNNRILYSRTSVTTAGMRRQ